VCQPHSGDCLLTTIAAHNYRLFGRTSTINGKPGPTTDAGGVEAPNSGVMVPAEGIGFDREAAQKRKGRFPDFNYFWPFGS